MSRNQQLLDGSDLQTSAAFLYQTPLIEASEAVTPLNSWPQRIDITNMGNNPTSALQATFQALFGDTTGLPLTFGMYYGYELVAPTSSEATGLVSYLPVSLYPNQLLSANTASSINSALDNWFRINQPATSGGEWVFSLTIYAQLDPTTRHPLLSLEKLAYRLSPADLPQSVTSGA